MQSVLECLRRILTKRGVQVHFRPRNTLRELLVAPKNKIKKEDQCGIVYKLSCVDCPATYEDKTKRSLGTRVSEHRREGSPIAEHRDRGHNIPSDHVQIIDKDPAWFTRGSGKQLTLGSTKTHSIRTEADTISRRFTLIFWADWYLKTKPGAQI